jgi:hypothetical protein
VSSDFRKVRPGQPLRITAKAWNRVLDTVATQPEFAGNAGIYGRPCHIVQIKNTTGSTIPKWGALAITGIANDPTAGASSLAQFQDVPILEGAAPSNTTAGKFVVAVEPIAAGKFGRAAIDGVVQCKLEVAHADDRFVACGSGGLKTAASGEGLVLWKESGTGTDKWALVQLAHDRMIVRGTFTGAWAKGATTTVTDATATSTSYEGVKNYIASLLPSDTMPCQIAYVAGEWVLVAWDWSGLSGYSGSTQQVLTHNTSGQLVWVSTTACT